MCQSLTVSSSVNVASSCVAACQSSQHVHSTPASTSTTVYVYSKTNIRIFTDRYFVASFPYFNGTGSVYVCIRKSICRYNRFRIEIWNTKISVDIRIFFTLYGRYSVLSAGYKHVDFNTEYFSLIWAHIHSLRKL